MPGGAATFRVLNAARESVEETMALEEFYAVCDEHREGFWHQHVTSLMPPGPGEAGPPPPRERLSYPASQPDFQPLKRKLEDEWLPAMLRLLRIPRRSLPALWDADFLYGPRTADGEDTFVLWEINVSSVLPFPESALEPLARSVASRVWPGDLRS